MKKPEFPPARLIREDFLPLPEPMKNYRIKKVYAGLSPVYYVQRRFLWFWWADMYQPDTIIADGNPFPNKGGGFCGQGFFLTLEEAKAELHRDLKFKASRKCSRNNKPEYIYNID